MQRAGWTCFNEAAPLGARKYATLNLNVRERLASMRPRPSERGNGQPDHGYAIAVIASMRPRPSERGNIMRGWT